MQPWKINAFKSILEKEFNLTDKFSLTEDFGKCRLGDKPIGSGGYGVVFELYDKHDSLTALKVVEITKEKTSKGNNTKEFKNIEREIENIKALENDNNILTFYKSSFKTIESDTTDTLIILIQTKYIKSNLNKYIIDNYDRKTKTYKIKNFETSYNYITGIANGLKHIHDEGYLHRDIKPSNILCDDQRAYISDFGSARKRDGKLTFGDVGTQNYVAPEMYNETSSYDHRVDIYSFGLTIYELLESKLPFEDDTKIEYIKKRKEDKNYKLNFKYTKDETLKSIITKTTQPDPNDRFNSMNEIIELLNNPKKAKESGGRDGFDDVFEEDEKKEEIVTQSIEKSKGSFFGNIFKSIFKYNYNKECNKYYEQGKLEDAINCYQEAIELNSTNYIAIKNLKKLQMILKTANELINYFENEFITFIDLKKTYEIYGKTNIYSNDCSKDFSWQIKYNKEKDSLVYKRKLLELKRKYFEVIQHNAIILHRAQSFLDVFYTENDKYSKKVKIIYNICDNFHQDTLKSFFFNLNIENIQENNKFKKMQIQLTKEYKKYL
ncbi:MAG: protein kinase [Campylobacterota bacterium]|nr:protein kinase [Campylobacterota bacterium]